jgi:chromate reductase
MKADKHLLILNGSIRGDDGNCGRVAERAAEYALEHPAVRVSLLTLANPMPSLDAVQLVLESADAILVLSGVYWNSWGSPLQRFLEVATVFENGPAFFGKPVACVVTMDSVGGSDIAARMHAALSGLGCWSPPCSTLVLSRIAESAVAHTRGDADDPNEDVWRIGDLEIVIRNLILAAALPVGWASWDKISLRHEGGEWPASGSLDLGSPRFL